MSRRPDIGARRPLPPPPDRKSLREAALAHLGRFAATERSLTLVLERRVTRWGRRAVEDGQESSAVADTVNSRLPLAAAIAKEMVTLGAVNDHDFARSRAARLTRSGRSRRAVQAQLSARGIDSPTTEQALDETLGQDEMARDAEIAAALIFARKRRAGPFQHAEQPDDAHDDADENHAGKKARLYGAFALAGFSRDVTDRALGMDAEEAESRILTLKASL
ncbi:RecX family transcriptional regulator [Acetobacter sp.]|jgi:regulatory protein|uniref:RecX family transcriptional regulator n=1 Tax=Acetobacter sp. TaxID=440 RepID=UPI0025C39504|nr:RecX family transcriptional regulator [Acetobacter sp.]MCH4091787.1 RecX family transcriptional regulator [Acetobacter sp.]MCI1300357.1 RecX family transcriptional regulator [Acetobacter sp.]MCI1316825.1 RecX family transcriptional regulator [Acetobacter sp.]